ncbi:hypothetical protein MSG28_009882 [Choristoneura fumiferana]|uniref:Uncharacterized protein n=1 Tax=Choristoneura fumiferana TaxID=7141 RepID=A0ACC0JCY9_CHOFU|nr:hypothetical protein MSG28_009882 [Choristoneura fumiferana]
MFRANLYPFVFGATRLSGACGGVRVLQQPLSRVAPKTKGYGLARNIHNIKEEEKVAETLKEFINAHQLAKTATSSSKLKKKDYVTLAKDMAIWCCKSLMPFDSISDEGMKDFFQKYKIIGAKEDIPSRDAVCRTALDSIYESLLENVKTQINVEADNHAAVTFDLWTDHYRRLNYITFRLYYLTADFEHKSFTLCTKVIDGKKTSEKIQTAYNTAMRSFGLQEKKIHSVTNAGSEVKSAVSLLALDNHLCLGHALNILITVDGIRSVKELDEFVKKCKRIIETIQHHLPELDKDAVEFKIEFISSLEQVSEHLENDDKEPLDYEEKIQGGKNNMLSMVASPTRWYIILAMLECLALGNRDSINIILSQVGNQDLKIYPREWILLEDVIKFLTKFREVIEMITSQKTASLNLAMVFHLEIKDMLNSLSDEESLIMLSVKHNMLEKLETRFPVTDKIVAAAMLDPRFISLSQIDTYLTQKKTTRADFLAGYIKAQPLATSDGSPVFVACGTYSTESLLTRLSKKHSIGASNSNVDYDFDETEGECRKYLATAIAEEFRGDDILLYWHAKKSSFPLLSEAARALLAIPATSTPSKLIFSEAGLTLNAKKTRLVPSCMNKIMFIHDNYNC